MNEEWRPITIKGEPWPYEVSNLARIRRTEPDGRGRKTYIGKIAKTFVDDKGYEALTFSQNGARKVVRVHSLVSEAFMGQRPEGYHTNHKDGNKLNNEPSNLEFLTPSEHAYHKYRMGLAPNRARGSGNAASKLTERDVLKIKARLLSGEVILARLAKEFGVSTSAISRIAKGETWRHLKP